MDKTLEKAQLAEEIGMTLWAQKVKARVEMQNEARRLGEMNLKITDEGKIREQLATGYWDFKEMLRDAGGAIVGIPVFFGVIGAAIGGVAFETVSAVVIGGAIPVLLSAMFFVGAARRETIIDSMPLERWTDNIPFGALLAVKEAKERGLHSFTIYYPITERSARLKVDPVIVGWAKKETRTVATGGWMIHGNHAHTIEKEFPVGPMIEVFAWDDGKVYE